MDKDKQRFKGFISVQCIRGLASLLGSKIAGIHARPPVGALFMEHPEHRISGLILKIV